MKEFQWQTPEYHYTERNSDWYWTVGIITAALVIVAFIFGDALFGLVVAISAFALAMFSARKPRMIRVEVSGKGVTIDKVLYQYPTLDSFFVDEGHHRGHRLMLKSKKIMMPLIVVPVDSDPTELRAFLMSRLKEEQFDQGFMQLILEKFGF